MILGSPVEASQIKDHRGYIKKEGWWVKTIVFIGLPRNNWYQSKIKYTPPSDTQKSRTIYHIKNKNQTIFTPVDTDPHHFK